MLPATLHPIVSAASEGQLPEWAVASSRRREHMGRVAALLESWSAQLGLAADERTRWRAAGHLHDALRDERPAVLRDRVEPKLRDLDGSLLHGPAAASMLWSDGVTDGELLKAVAYHTMGDPTLGRMGRALYAADFLEPGRSFRSEWRAALRARMPEHWDQVLREIVAARLGHRLETRGRILPRTVAFWNAIVAGSR